MKKLGGLLVAGAVGAGFVGAAQAHVSIGVGIGVPAYPVYAAPPAPVPDPKHFLYRSALRVSLARIFAGQPGSG